MSLKTWSLISIYLHECRQLWVVRSHWMHPVNLNSLLILELQELTLLCLLTHELYFLLFSLHRFNSMNVGSRERTEATERIQRPLRRPNSCPDFEKGAVETFISEEREEGGGESPTDTGTQTPSHRGQKWKVSVRSGCMLFWTVGVLKAKPIL